MRRAFLALALLHAGCWEGADVSLGDLPRATPDGGPGSECPAGGEAVTATMSAFLSECAGFGCSAIGGMRGCVYHVTSLADAGPGTLRDGAEREGALWIVFDVAGAIDLQSSVQLQSNKTIDGRGVSVTLRGYGLLLGTGRSNVVIENMSFANGANVDNNDAIQIADASRVWIDHGTFSSFGDGLVDITRGATDVTVSWSLFANHPLVMLIGRSADDTGDANIRVTAHHNWWNQTGSYAPRARFGKVHTFNNLIDRWKDSASSITMGGQLFSEANIFVAGDEKDAVSTSQGSDPLPGKARSSGDWLQNGAVVHENEPD
ncbi:MAG: polysaccharide lyase family 1 protein, partial [Polyangiaceae bacterium]